MADIEIRYELLEQADARSRKVEERADAAVERLKRLADEVRARVDARKRSNSISSGLFL